MRRCIQWKRFRRDDSQSGITSGWLTCPCQLSPAAGFQVDSCYLVTGQTKQAVALLKLCLRCDNFSYFLADDRGLQKKNASYNYGGMINLIKEREEISHISLRLSNRSICSLTFSYYLSLKRIASPRFCIQITYAPFNAPISIRFKLLTTDRDKVDGIILDVPLKLQPPEPHWYTYGSNILRWFVACKSMALTFVTSYN